MRVDTFRVTAYQWMPIEQGFTLRQQPIGACLRQPVKFGDVSGCQDLAVGHLLPTVLVIPASARMQVKQPASNIRIMNFASVIVDQFVETALAAPVTQAFPLFDGHVGEFFGFPERQASGCHRVCSIPQSGRTWLSCRHHGICIILPTVPKHHKDHQHPFGTGGPGRCNMGRTGWQAHVPGRRRRAADLHASNRMPSGTKRWWSRYDVHRHASISSNRKAATVVTGYSAQPDLP